ncbi:Crp/Fnr family transcriptional regulator [Pedobacter riviphilus]|uniref:Crp/Fnr family transcriptional regulator n=1 Tax=Pedobacter riviphilus TaxID=2766984 RepID=A0ABX6TMG5_9SPHI|nr:MULTISPECIES: Crp/Fnr family transcriptional regulator [Pedobacter]NII82314.1 CRP-like cAMP-binding protein [Pedobacter sp. SG908]NMN36338.1 CRP-like cAMP-binding protein [Pedobacter sp. SG918]QNR86096.1 Crp/Fnr family transcriptional regulator [Pedobacter riviphilus]
MIAVNLSDGDRWKKYNDFSPLISVFKKFHPLNNEIEKRINQHTFPISYKKNKYLVSPVDRNKFLFLIVKGVVRGFIKDGDNEITTWIAKENEVVGTIRNLWIDGESDEYLQALEDVDLVAIPHVLSEYLYENFPEANIVGRKMMELYYRSAEERAYLCRISSAEKRYKRFLISFPDLINRVSLKYIASFLAIRLETLSRIRAKI